jgi:hypothetical protein
MKENHSVANLAEENWKENKKIDSPPIRTRYSEK